MFEFFIVLKFYWILCVINYILFLHTLTQFVDVFFFDKTISCVIKNPSYNWFTSPRHQLDPGGWLAHPVGSSRPFSYFSWVCVDISSVLHTWRALGCKLSRRMSDSTADRSSTASGIRIHSCTDCCLASPDTLSEGSADLWLKWFSLPHINRTPPEIHALSYEKKSYLGQRMCDHLRLTRNPFAFQNKVE